MKRLRAAIGTVVFVFSVGLVLSPGGVPPLPLALFLMASFGLTVTLGGLAMVSMERDSGSISVSTVESAQSLSTPGDDIERQLSDLSSTPETPDEIENYRKTKLEVTDHLRELTVAILIDRHGVNEQRAHNLLDEGTWCEDPHAVAFFTGQYPEWAPSTVRYRENSNTLEVSLQTQAGHVIDVLAAMDAGDVEPPGLARTEQETGGEKR